MLSVFPPVDHLVVVIEEVLCNASVGPIIGTKKLNEGNIITLYLNTILMEALLSSIRASLFKAKKSLSYNYTSVQYITSTHYCLSYSLEVGGQRRNLSGLITEDVWFACEMGRSDGFVLLPCWRFPVNIESCRG